MPAIIQEREITFSERAKERKDREQGKFLQI
jgi:hypothetical protein